MELYLYHQHQILCLTVNFNYTKLTILTEQTMTPLNFLLHYSGKEVLKSDKTFIKQRSLHNVQKLSLLDVTYGLLLRLNFIIFLSHFVTV